MLTCKTSPLKLTFLVSVGLLVFSSAVVGRWGQTEARGLQPHQPNSGLGQESLPRLVTPDTPLNARLVDAVEQGNLEAVRDLLAQGASANTRIGWEGRPESSPVTRLAAQEMPDKYARYLPIFRLLIAHLTDPNASDANGYTVLMDAVDMDDLQSVERLVAQGADVNARVKRFGAGANVLYLAVMRGGNQGKDPSPITLFLLAHGAEVNVQNEQGATPLIAAAEFGRIETAKVLLAHGADPAPRMMGMTALRMASLRGYADVVRLLSERTPMSLVEAAQFGKLERVRACLDAGDDPNTPEARAGAPLIAAMKSKNVAVTELLLDRGATINGRDTQGLTALHYAATYGEIAQAALLLKRGADINAASPGNQFDKFTTPLLCAIKQARADMVDFLLKQGIKLAAHGQGVSALELAVRTAGQRPDRTHEAPPPALSDDALLDAQNRIIERLLASGVSVRANHSRALYLAASNAQNGLVMLLLKRGADVNGRELVEPSGGLDAGQTALIGAIEACDMAHSDRTLFNDGTNRSELRDAEDNARTTVKLLLAKGANVNTADAGGATPLMHCLSENLLDLAKMLLVKGARVDAVDREGRTALMQAAAADNRSMAGFLLARGADANRRAKTGRTALMLAIDDGANDRFKAMRRLENDHLRYAHGENPPPISRREWPNPEGHPAMVKLLLHRANVNVVATNGTTALTLARKSDFKRVITLLLQAGAR